MDFHDLCNYIILQTYVDHMDGYHGQVRHRQHPEGVDVPEQSVVGQKLAQREQGEGRHQVHLQGPGITWGAPDIESRVLSLVIPWASLDTDRHKTCWFYKVDGGWKILKTSDYVDSVFSIKFKIFVLMSMSEQFPNFVCRLYLIKCLPKWLFTSFVLDLKIWGYSKYFDRIWWWYIPKTLFWP